MCLVQFVVVRCVGGLEFYLVLLIHGVLAEVVTQEAECYIDGFSLS